jgi:hypothetical protein
VPKVVVKLGGTTNYLSELTWLISALLCFARCRGGEGGAFLDLCGTCIFSLQWISSICLNKQIKVWIHTLKACGNTMDKNQIEILTNASCFQMFAHVFYKSLTIFLKQEWDKWE